MAMQTRIAAWTIAASVFTGALSAAQAQVTTCRNTGSFDRWLEEFHKEALSQGISRQTIAAAAPYMTFEPRVIGIDRGQRVFGQSFVEFSQKLVPAGRLGQGHAQLKRHAASFAKLEQQYGVPGPVIVAFWGLESDYGGNKGKEPALRALTTLAYDCRRPQMFREQLHFALRLFERGDITPERMIGSWAGEVGHMQFMPKEYFQSGVDFDGDGKRDIINSVPDALASSANYVSGLGWRRGEPWLEEVRVPQTLKWEEADLAIRHPRSQWVNWGVRAAQGSLPADQLPASLVLPMGRFGPAFLAYPNFTDVYLKWNQSLVYSLTAAYFATRLTGAPALNRGSPDIQTLSVEQAKELQSLLVRQGYDVGGVDGRIGLATRAAVKKAQLKFKMPADSYPTAELIARLRR